MDRCECGRVVVMRLEKSMNIMYIMWNVIMRGMDRDRVE